MKKFFVLLVSLALLAGCTSKRMVVTPVGGSIKVIAINADEIPLVKGDTVILYESFAGLHVGYIIANDFILHKSWAKYDSATGVYGRKYYKAVVSEDY